MLLSSLSLLAYHDQKLCWWGRSGFNNYQGKCDEYTIIRGRGRDGVITSLSLVSIVLPRVTPPTHGHRHFMNLRIGCVVELETNLIKDC